MVEHEQSMTCTTREIGIPLPEDYPEDSPQDASQDGTEDRRRYFNKKVGHGIREFMTSNRTFMQIHDDPWLRVSALVPYVLDPAYLTCFLTASALHRKKFLMMGPHFSKIMQRVERACGVEQYRVFENKALKIYSKHREDLYMELPGGCIPESLYRLQFHCVDLIFPGISSFGQHQVDIRILSLKFHEFLLRKKITLIPITATGTLYVNLPPYIKVPVNNHKQQLDTALSTIYRFRAIVTELSDIHFYSGVRKLLCCLIDLVLVRKIYRCKDTDIQEILIDWFCNDYDAFWSRGTWELIERLVLRYTALVANSGNIHNVERQPWNRLHLLNTIHHAYDLEFQEYIPESEKSFLCMNLHRRRVKTKPTGVANAVDKIDLDLIVRHMVSEAVLGIVPS